jgi:two-component system response regulator DctR
MNLPLNGLPPPCVIAIDDDAGMLKSMEFLLKTERIDSYFFSGGPAFFEAVKATPELLNGPGCILLDVRMPDMNGLEVFDRLISIDPNLNLPIVFITGHGDVALVTKVLKQGAVDFITKPYSAEDLLLRLHECFDISRSRFIRKANIQSVEHRIKQLTEREFFVMGHLFEGLSNKDIAEIMGNSVRTIELRRAAIYDKLQVKSAVELARLLENAEWKKNLP